MGDGLAEQDGRTAAVIAHVTATGLVLADGHVLLVDHSTLAGWMAPGGHVEDGEYPEQTLRRELLEEVGLEVDLVGEHADPEFGTVTAPWRVHVYAVNDHPSGGGSLLHVDCVYVCTPPDGGRLAVGGEYASRARWVPVEEVAALETYRELPGLVASAASFARRCGPRKASATSMDKEMIERLIKESQVEAQRSIDGGDPPFGCIITDDAGRVVARAHNTQNSDCDPTAHAEIQALRQLSQKLGTLRLDGYVMFANAASCPMCTTAAIKAGVTTFFYGAPPEPGMNPWVTMEEIASRARHQVDVFGPNLNLGDECTEQIAHGRSRRSTGR